MHPQLVKLLILCVCISFGGLGYSQVGDCTLNLNGKDKNTLIEVFQLNDTQKVQMENWSQELTIANKVLQEEIDLLLKTHPQQTQEELTELAQKYRVLQHKMVANSKAYDIKLLQSFNRKQYKLYTDLCAEVMRTPLLGILPED